MPGTMKKKLKIVQDLKITSPAVEDTCFVNKPEDEIKQTNTGIQGNHDSFTFLNKEYITVSQLMLIFQITVWLSSYLIIVFSLNSTVE